MQLIPDTFRAWRVEETSSETSSIFAGGVRTCSLSSLPEGEVLVRVQYSSLNYKDALSANGNRGVTRQYPHTPGIDAVGEVMHSRVAGFDVGDEVIVTGYDLGMNTAGGFSEFIRVPASWLVRLPPTLTAFDAMVLGTAGLTAALCIQKLLRNGMQKEGEVLVTGASGGVGSLAVALLAHLGFSVCASTGKKEAHAMLTGLGASRIIDRHELQADSPKPLLKEQWAGVVDVVGGKSLWAAMKALRYGASAASCGLVESAEFPATVYPFILRGVNLLGVDSVNVPLQEKEKIWHLLATDWKLPSLNTLVTAIGFDQLQACLDALMAGQSIGRVVLAVTD